jgi:ribosomal protein S27AE
VHGYADEGRTQKLANVWGHYAVELLSLSILAAILIGLRPPSGPAALSIPLALFVFVIGSWLMMRHHDRQLCAKCAAAMPLNAAETAARYQRRFWMAHTGAERRFLIPYLVVLVGSNFATATTVGKLAWAIIQSSMIYLLLSHSTHRRLQPWCPWCSDGGGGSHRHESAPDPVLPNQLV